LKIERVAKPVLVENSFRNGTILNCFKPSIESTLVLQQLVLVICSFDAVVVSELQQVFTFEKTATSTSLDPQKWDSILNENVDKSTKSASSIEKTL
jgi:hypothetical protein